MLGETGAYRSSVHSSSRRSAAGTRSRNRFGSPSCPNKSAAATKERAGCRVRPTATPPATSGSCATAPRTTSALRPAPAIAGTSRTRARPATCAPRERALVREFEEYRNSSSTRLRAFCLDASASVSRKHGTSETASLSSPWRAGSPRTPSRRTPNSSCGTTRRLRRSEQISGQSRLTFGFGASGGARRPNAISKGT